MSPAGRKGEVNVMAWDARDSLLVTGATGLVGSHVAERSVVEGIKTRAIVRDLERAAWLRDLGVETVVGDMTDHDSLRAAVEGVSMVVHCAAKVGDWGPVESYREVNVEGLKGLIEAAQANGVLKRFIQISSLGVYQARDHHGTDESESPDRTGIDGYTLTKVESEDLVLKFSNEQSLPAIVLRPGFIYGPRDRTVLPRLLDRLKSGGVKYLGSGDQLLNNTCVTNLVDAVFLALDRDDLDGEIFNITDGRLVSKREFIGTIASLSGLPEPTKSVPLGLAKRLARIMEGTWRLLGKKEAPLLSSARIKFLGLNLDFDIGKARRELGYDPAVEFAEGMALTIEWCRQAGMVPSEIAES